MKMFGNRRSQRKLDITISALTDQCKCGALALGDNWQQRRVCLNCWGRSNLEHAAAYGYWPPTGPRV